MKQLYSHLAVHPQIIAVPHVTALPFKLRSLGYISDNKSCRQRKKSTKIQEEVLPQALGYKFQTSIVPGRYAGARRKVTAAPVKKSLSSSAVLPPGPVGDTKRLPGACCHGAASCKEIRGGRQPGEAAGAGRPLGRRGKGDLSRKKEVPPLPFLHQV